MAKMDKLTAIIYLVENNPVCDDCARGNLEEIRIAAGLYQLIKDIVIDSNKFYSKNDLDDKIRQATTF